MATLTASTWPHQLTRQEQLAVRAFVEGLRDRFGNRLSDCKLFGSIARGERWAESDIDILVVITALTHQEKLSVWDTAHDFLLSHDTFISPLVLTPEELQFLRDRERRIALDIDAEGVPL